MHARAADEYEWAAGRPRALKWVRRCIFTQLAAHIHTRFGHILTEESTHDTLGSPAVRGGTGLFPVKRRGGGGCKSLLQFCRLDLIE